MSREPFIGAAAAGPCFICGLTEDRLDRPWFDEPVATAEGLAVALLGVGAISPGYVLACPSRHVTSLAQLLDREVDPFCEFVDSIKTQLEERFGPVVLFEHAGCQADDPASAACVAHAHLHIWSIADRVTLRLPQREDAYPDLAAFLRRRQDFVTAPYLLAQNDDGVVRVGPSNGTSQYFRRQVAVQIGRPDEWDYAAFPFESHMIETREGLGLER